jgi:phosphatidate phosphatase APP1
LRDFVRTNSFPEGSWHLRDFAWEGEILRGFFEPSDAHKITTVERLIGRFPKRRFLLVGDSGERDPEIYGELARRHPDRISGILIRQVTEERAEHERYVMAFAGVPRERWRLFNANSEADAQVRAWWGVDPE